MWCPWCDAKGISLQVALPASLPILQFEAGERSYFPGKIKKRKFSPLTVFSFLFNLKPEWNTVLISISITYLFIQHLFTDFLLSSLLISGEVMSSKRDFSGAHSRHGPIVKPRITIWNKGPWVSLQEPPPSGLSQPPEGESSSLRRKQTLSLGSRKRSLNGYY